MQIARNVFVCLDAKMGFVIYRLSVNAKLDGQGCFVTNVSYIFIEGTYKLLTENIKMDMRNF